MRLSPRVVVRIPAEIERGAMKEGYSHGKSRAWKAPLSGTQSSPLRGSLLQAKVLLRYELPQQGVLEHTAILVRKDS